MPPPAAYAYAYVSQLVVLTLRTEGKGDVEPILLRPAKAAQVADISRSVAYDLIARGEWPSIKVGRSLRVPVKDLLEWVEANKRPSRTGVSVPCAKDATDQVAQ